MSRLIYPFLISLTLAAGAILYLEKRGEDPLALLALSQANAQSAPAVDPLAGWGSGPSAGVVAYPEAPVATRPHSWPGAPPAAPAPAGPPAWTPPQPAGQPPMADPTGQPLFSGPPPAAGVSLPGASLAGTAGQPAAAGATPGNDVSEIPNAQIIGRVGNDVILAGEIIGPIDVALAAYRDKLSPSQLEAQRTAAIRQSLEQAIEMKLMAVEARRNLPPEGMKDVEGKLAEQFEQVELPRMLKQYGASNRAELDAKLRARGTSLDRIKRIMFDSVLGSEWRRTKLKVDDEVTHEQMLEYYQQHASDFDVTGQVRWEQISVRLGRYPDKPTAYRVIADAGNALIDGRPFGDVARAMSDGFTASEGGVHNWTTQGSLASHVLNEALFTLPVGSLSPILEDDRFFHIVRVVERREAGRQPFVEAQVEIKTRIREQRTRLEMQKYLAGLRANTQVWTMFDGPESAR